MKKTNHPWYWPAPRYFANVEPNREGAQVMRYLDRRYCIQEVASCSSLTRAERIAAALNRDEKRRKAKKGGAE